MKIDSPIGNFTNRLYPQGSVTQWFGENHDLYYNAVIIDGIHLQGHNGIDIVAPWGTPIYAVEGGIVCEVKDDATGYGKHVRIFCPDTCREWTYGHLSFILCELGSKISTGDEIGLMGNTGFVVSDSDGLGYWGEGANKYGGTHLHLGLRQMRFDNKGWRYAGYSKKVEVENYDNGYFGAIDPRELLPQPAPLPEFEYEFKNEMKLGDRSVDVGKLQELLYRLGFFKVGVTSYYGPVTRQAVFDFQNEYVPLSYYERFILSGSKVGPKTLLALNSRSKC